MNFMRPKHTLVTLLQRAGRLDREATRHVQDAMVQGARTALEVIVEEGLLSETEIFEFLAENLEVPAVGLENLEADDAIIASLSPKLRERIDLLPMRQAGQTLTVAMADPTDPVLIEQIEQDTALKVRPMLAPLSALKEAHTRRKAMVELRGAIALDEDLSAYEPFFQRLRDYRFEKIVGRGGFGLVARCWQLSLERPVAIKVLDPEWVRVGNITERFRREGRIIARLDHPCIINVFEQGERDGFHFIVMEYFEGQTIRDYLGAHDWARRISVLMQVSAALDYAHSQGVIHRDIKPSNILVNKQGAIRLLDFGVAQCRATAEKLTEPNMVLGTPKYMAPELSQGADQATVASDLFAFGVMAYQILTGRLDRDAPLEHPTNLDARVPRPMGDMILACMAEDPAKRPRSFSELTLMFQQSMDRLLFGEATSRHRRLDETQTRHQRMTIIERLFEFKSVLRQDARCKTLVAFHRQLGRDVVVKLIEEPVGVDRLDALNELHHANIAETFGMGKQGGLVLAVTEYLEEGPLTELLEMEHSPRRQVAWLAGIISALREAERNGLHHGNLHPNNILMAPGSTVKVIDFGLKTEPCPMFERYQFQGGAADPRLLDLFALGVLVYELLSGQTYHAPRDHVWHHQLLCEMAHVHPLMKYFLGRLWGLERSSPEYESYDAMVQDLARIDQRLASQPDWMGGAVDQADLPKENRSTVAKT